MRWLFPALMAIMVQGMSSPAFAVSSVLWENSAQRSKTGLSYKKWRAGAMVGVVGASIRGVTGRRFITCHMFIRRLSMLRHQSMLRPVTAG